MAVEHVTAFSGRLVVDIVLVSRMVECRIVVVQMDCFVRVPTHGVGRVVVATIVVDRMVP